MRTIRIHIFSFFPNSNRGTSLLMRPRGIHSPRTWDDPLGEDICMRARKMLNNPRFHYDSVPHADRVTADTPREHVPENPPGRFSRKKPEPRTTFPQ